MHAAIHGLHDMRVNMHIKGIFDPVRTSVGGGGGKLHPLCSAGKTHRELVAADSMPASTLLISTTDRP
jgi:hypothetical protein